MLDAYAKMIQYMQKTYYIEGDPLFDQRLHARQAG